MNKYKTSLFAAVLFVGLTGGGIKAASAQLQHTLTAEKPVYLADDTVTDDPIRLVMTFVNQTGGTVYASKEFLNQLWHLRLTFFDPDGEAHRADDADGSQVLPEPGKGVQCETGVVGEKDDCDPLDLLEDTYDQTIRVPLAPDDARRYYSVLQWGEPAGSRVKTGQWRVESNIPLRTYPGVDTTVKGVPYAFDRNVLFDDNLRDTTVFTIVGDYDGDGYPYPSIPAGWDPDFAVLDCDDRRDDVSPGQTEVPGDGLDNDCDAGTPDAVPGGPMGAVELTAKLHIVGNKNTYPDAGKSPLGGLPFKVVDKANDCFADLGLRFNHWQDRGTVYNSCMTPYSGITDAVTGAATVALLAGSEYVIVARYAYDDDDPAKVVYLGVVTGMIGEDVTTTKFLQALLRADGSLVSGRYKERKGSLLHIIEPEYIEWDSTEETYPIVFDAIGDWTVTTAVAPPEGFVTDHEALSTEVNSELNAVQFTITDIGSDWVSTGIEYEIKHKGKKEKIKSKVGMKLSRKLARQKNLPWCGEECPDKSSALYKTIKKDLKKKSKTKSDK